MENLTNIKYIKQLFERNGFTFSKRLGQNFLINPAICPKMAEECDCQGKGVIEIGPGIGVLTAQLAERAAKVVAIEVDERLKPILNTTLKNYDNVEVIFDDIMKINLDEFIKKHFGDMEVVVCANLPYYITSPVIMMLLESRLPISSITVMVQKEAAQRLTAKVGTRQSGAITVAVNYFATTQKLFDVKRGSFLPAPNVDSSVIKLSVQAQPPISVTDEKMFFKVVRASFSQRRKTIANSLSFGLHINKEKIISLLTSLELNTSLRAEQLTLAQFAMITNQLLERD